MQALDELERTHLSGEWRKSVLRAGRDLALEPRRDLVVAYELRAHADLSSRDQVPALAQLFAHCRVARVKLELGTDLLLGKLGNVGLFRGAFQPAVAVRHRRALAAARLDRASPDVSEAHVTRDGCSHGRGVEMTYRPEGLEDTDWKTRIE